VCSDRTWLTLIPDPDLIGSKAVAILCVDMSIHSETISLLHEMELVYQSITSYQPATNNPPILDAVVTHDSQHLSGLRPFLETVKRDIDVVKQVPPCN
jgi:hypothetical protein